MGELCGFLEAALNNRAVLELSELVHRGVRIIVEQGDITTMSVDAIVNPANSQLVMGGGVAGAIRRAGGREIEDEALSRAPIRVGNAVGTTSGRLHARYVIHAPTMTFPASRTDAKAVHASTLAALNRASELGVTSIAFPGMGTGVGGVEPKAAASVMLQAIYDHLQSATTLKEIRLIAFDKELRDAFGSALATIKPT